MRTIILNFIASTILVLSSLASSWNIDELSMQICWDGASDVVYQNGYAYVATGIVSDLWTVDVSDPAALQATSYWSFQGVTYQVVVEGQNAFTLTTYSFNPNEPWHYLITLNSFDINTPASPIHLNSYSLGVAYLLPLLEVHGQYAYYYIYNALHVLDISDPSVPVEIGSCTPSNHPVDICYSEGYLYCLSTFTGSSIGFILIIDVSDPTNPQEVASYSLPVYWDEGDLMFSETNAFLTTPEGLMVLDCSDPLAPVEIACTEEAAGEVIDIEENTVVLGLRGDQYNDNMIYLLDISNPADPLLTSSYQLPHYPSGIDLDGQNLFVADGDEGLKILDVSVPASIVESGSLGSDGPFSDAALSGDYALLAAGDDGLTILDVTDPRHPEEVLRWTEISQPQAIKIADNLAYVADGGYLSVVDIQNPLAPELVADCPCYSYPVHEMMIIDEYAYVSGDDFYIIDITNAMAPTQVAGYVSIITETAGFDINGHFVFLAERSVFCWEGQLVVLDVSQPSNIRTISTLYMDSCPKDVEIVGHYAYVSSDVDGFYIIDIFDPLQPEIITRVSTGGGAQKLVALGDHLWVAGLEDRLWIYNIEEPLNPYLVGWIDKPGSGWNLTFDDNLLYLSDWCAFSIYNCSDALPVMSETGANFIPSSFSLSAYPNPFNPATTITFEIPVAGKVKFAVFDVHGRDVTGHLLPTTSGYYAPGIHHTPFNGSNLTSGIYFVRLETDEIIQTQKLVLLK